MRRLASRFVRWWAERLDTEAGKLSAEECEALQRGDADRADTLQRTRAYFDRWAESSRRRAARLDPDAPDPDPAPGSQSAQGDPPEPPPGARMPAIVCGSCGSQPMMLVRDPASGAVTCPDCGEQVDDHGE